MLAEVQANHDEFRRARNEVVAAASRFGRLGDGTIHFSTSLPISADKSAFLARRGATNDVVHAIASGGAQRDNPAFLKGRERIIEDMRKAGVPEG